LKVKVQGKIFAEIPSRSLVLGGGAPVYIRETAEPAYFVQHRAFDPATLPRPKNLTAVLRRLLASPSITGKEWVYNQYDSMVRTNTVVAPGADAAVIRIKGTKKALAMKVDCNARYVYLHPRRGAQIAVAEAARNVVCAGARPAAVTNCLNFGNPYKPEMYWQFKEAVEGMGEACRVLETPVTGGNVSFYNESPGGAVYPTPAIGMLGVMEDVAQATTSWFKNSGDAILLVGRNLGEVGGSEYLKMEHGLVTGEIPALSLSYEKAVQEYVLEAIRRGLVRSAHDVSDGGLAVALAECCLQGKRGHTIGAVLRISEELRPDFLLFGESQSMIVLSAALENTADLMQMAAKTGVSAVDIGRVGGEELTINDWVRIGTREIESIYRDTLPTIMG
jgi:phosphoribosylformylglycinamidine synthase